MSTPTLTIPMNDKDPDNSMVTFAFVRDFENIGGWITRTHFGQTKPNTYVHAQLGLELSALARAKEMVEQYGFSKNPPKPVKPEPGKRGPRAKKVKEPTLMGGFNPFQMGG